MSKDQIAAIDEALRLLQLGSELDVVKAIELLKRAQAEKQAALDRMAENARELGLSYEVEQERSA